MITAVFVESLPLCFIGYFVLFYLLFSATVTDFKTLTISDRITVFGTVFAVAFSMLPVNCALSASEICWNGYNPIITPMPLNLFSPNPAVPMTPVTVWIVCSGLWCFWCFAMLDRFWYPQFPFRKNCIVFFRHLYRSRQTKYYFSAALAGSAFFALNPCLALLSSLTGAAAGMCLIWGTRIICSYVLRQEAMGFGDVTLMGMIGAFLGWQPCVLIFFLAPFAGLIFGIVQWILKGNNRLPYGPFLSAAAVLTFLAWRQIWQNTADIFSLGGVFIGISMCVCLLLMGVLLRAVRLFFAQFQKN
jgi:prepilin signal peptidase PulO-like enzyme (type II secretory pathway)